MMPMRLEKPEGANTQSMSFRTARPSQIRNVGHAFLAAAFGDRVAGCDRLDCGVSPWLSVGRGHLQRHRQSNVGMGRIVRCVEDSHRR